jgi:hypothetical protein
MDLVYLLRTTLLAAEQLACCNLHSQSNEGIMYGVDLPSSISATKNKQKGSNRRELFEKQRKLRSIA